MELRRDFDRWNQFARQHALDLICSLRNDFKGVFLAVGLYEEMQCLLNATEDDLHERRRKMDEPATELQKSAIDYAAEHISPFQNPSRREAANWLVEYAGFKRSSDNKNAGTFSWTDPDGSEKVLSIPLLIEVYIIQVIEELEKIYDDALIEDDPKECVRFDAEISVLFNKLSVLQEDLVRYDLHAGSEDLASCREFASAWRETRGKRS